MLCVQLRAKQKLVKTSSSAVTQLPPGEHFPGLCYARENMTSKSGVGWALSSPNLQQLPLPLTPIPTLQARTGSLRKDWQDKSSPAHPSIFPSTRPSKSQLWELWVGHAFLLELLWRENKKKGWQLCLRASCACSLQLSQLESGLYSHAEVKMPSAPVTRDEAAIRSDYEETAPDRRTD